MRLTKAQSEHVTRFNWNGATTLQEFKTEYPQHDQIETETFLAVTGTRLLTPAQARSLSGDMELIISRAEDSLDTSLFCGEVSDAKEDGAVLNCMRMLDVKLNNYLK